MAGFTDLENTFQDSTTDLLAHRSRSREFRNDHAHIIELLTLSSFIIKQRKSHSIETVTVIEIAYANNLKDISSINVSLNSSIHHWLNLTIP